MIRMPIPIRILLIADEQFLDYAVGGKGYGLRVLQQQICAIHYGGVPVQLSLADSRIALETHKPEAFDQIWLFGYDDGVGSRWSAAEQARLQELMDQGIGFFASGDHGSRGWHLCGSVPRIRWMRRWRTLDDRKDPRHNPDTGALERLDTRSGTSIHAVDPDGDQTPKVVVPQLEADGEPHPLFAADPRQGTGDLQPRLLPDHIHEGWCAPLPEFAQDVGGDLAPAPRVIACSPALGAPQSGGYGEPRLIPVFCAYDPDVSKTPHRGRLLVDSTFHHWIDKNLEAMPPWFFAQYRLLLRNLIRFLLPKERREQFAAWLQQQRP